MGLLANLVAMDAHMQMSYEMRLQRLHEDVRRAAMTSMNPYNQVGRGLQDACPMLSQMGGNPTTMQQQRPPNAFGGPQGPMPRVQLGRRKRSESPSPLGAPKYQRNCMDVSVASSSQSYSLPPHVQGVIMPAGAQEPMVQAQLMQPIRRPQQQHLQDPSMTNLRVQVPSASADIGVDATPSTTDALAAGDDLSNDEAASLLLALSPRALAGEKIPGLSLSRNPSGLSLPMPAIPTSALGPSPCVPAPAPSARSSSAASGWSTRLTSGDAKPLHTLPPSPRAGLNGPGLALSIDSSSATLEGCPMSRNVSGISMSRCLSMLNEPDPVPPTAGALAALADAAPGTPLAMHTLASSPAFSSRRPPLGGSLGGVGAAPTGGVLQGVPMSRDVSQISVSGFYSLLD